MSFTQLLNKNFNLVFYSFMILGGVTFLFLFFVTAPYGRHSVTGSQKFLGPAIGEKLGFCLEEIPAVFFPIIYYCFFNENKSSSLKILLIFWEIHYINRTFTMPLLRKTNPKNLPIGIVLSAVGFNTVNMYLIWFGLCNHNKDFITEGHFRSGPVIFGVVFFFVGLSGNLYSDWILVKLRKNKNDHGYKIPYGFLYEYISSPNYFCEMFEWFGWLLMTHFYKGSFSFFVWIVCVLFPRALSNHKWYKITFKEKFPIKRKAIIPFVI